MYGFKPGAMPKNRGGKIQGPGTGTSDSIKTEIPKGSYIMPADSTQQIGPQALGKLGQPVPVNVSSGEFQMPPEQVHAVGVQALNQMRDATHAPVAAGFKPQKDGLYFADGGSPAEEERKRLAGTGPSPQMGAVALGEQRRAERTGGSGLYSQANADLGRAASTAFPNTATAIRGAGQNIAEAYQAGGFPAAAGATVRNTLVPAIGFAADVGRSAKQALDPFANALKTAVTGDPTPIEGSRSPAAQPAQAATTQATSTPTAPASSPAAQGARAGYGFTPDPMQGPAQGMSVRPTSAPEINRIDNAPGLNSPLFTNLPAGQAVSEMQGGTVNTMPAAAFQSAGPAASRETSAALQAAAARGDWDAVRGFYQRDGGTWQGRTAEQDAAESQGPRGGVIGGSGRGFNFVRRSEERAADRAQADRRLSKEDALARDRLDIDRQRAEGEAQTRGFEVRGMQRMERLYQQFEAAETPEARAAIAEQIRALRGIDRENTAQVIYNEELINPAQPMAGTRRVPMLLNRDGTATAVTPRATQNAPDGMRYVGTSNGKPVYEDQNGRRFVQGGN